MILFINVDCPNCSKEIQLAVNESETGEYDVSCDICGCDFMVDTHDFEMDDEIEYNLN